MSFLVNIINEAIKDINKHLSSRLTKRQGQIPEAFLSKKISEVPLDPGMLAYDRTAEQESRDEVDKLALYLQGLNIGSSEDKYLNQRLKFGDLTWKDLMQLDYGSERGLVYQLNNNLNHFGIEYQKLIIMARLKFRLTELVKQASVFLVEKEQQISEESVSEAVPVAPVPAPESHHGASAKPPSAKNDGKKKKRSKGSKAGAQDIADAAKAKPREGAAGKAEELHGSAGTDELSAEPPVLESDERPDCVDEWLFKSVVAEISQAKVMTEKAETGQFNASDPGKFSGGQTKPKLEEYLIYVNDMYKFMKDFDEDDEVKRDSSDIYSLRDFLPDQYQNHDPVLLAYRYEMEYIQSNIIQEAQIRSEDERSWPSYVSSVRGLTDLATRAITLTTHYPKIADNKRDQVFSYLKQIQKLPAIDLRERVLDFTDTYWGTVKGLSGFSTYVIPQAAVLSFSNLHSALLQDATTAQRSDHQRKCPH